MNKILLVITREYVTRVRNKTFLLSTFLLPIVLLLFIFGSVFFASQAKESHKKIAVINDPGIFGNNLQTDSSKIIFNFAAGVDTLNFLDKGYDGVLDFKHDSVKRQYLIITKKQLGLGNKSYIEGQINKAFEKKLLIQSNIRKAVLDSIDQEVARIPELENRKWNGKSTENVNAGVTSGIGFGCGILIYITMFIFGAMVMRGVMEEKTNRIAEVMVSCIKPFQLMMGKIIGIACVGLTQLLLWLILILTLLFAVTFFIPHESIHEFQQMQQAGNLTGMGSGNSMAMAFLNTKSTVTNMVPWLLVISCFIFYFLGGYLFYASLFAAVGSVVNEDPQEAQSLMMPISMPLVFGFIIMSTNTGNPDSPAMFWGSIIPFTSPIVMMGRIPSGTVPMWQIFLSMLLLIGGFLFTTWLAAKIYRTGILLYGKKVTWKEMFKWAFRRS
ncbi:MAG: ABC transporter permease [Ferruginibacter sp.]